MSQKPYQFALFSNFSKNVGRLGRVGSVGIEIVYLYGLTDIGPVGENFA